MLQTPSRWPGFLEVIEELGLYDLVEAVRQSHDQLAHHHAVKGYGEVHSGVAREW